MSTVRGDRGQWVTLPGCKRVLVIAATEVYARRMEDLLPLLEDDLRIQVSFTVPPHAFNSGARGYLRRLGAAVLPWRDAVRTGFDLALAAGSQGIDKVRAPVVVMAHGARHLKLERRDGPGRDGRPRAVSGLGGRHLMSGGTVVPAAIALAHREEQAELERWCPESLPRAHVVGDPCHDRILASLPLRDRYRRAMGLRPGQRLVLVSCGWGSTSAFGRIDALLPRLITELPRPDYRPVLLVHPNVAAWHGKWQVAAWLAASRRAGVTVLGPGDDWRPPLVAADYVIGDYGSVTLYATMTGAPVLLSHYPHQDANPDSPGAALARTVPALSPSHRLPEQLAYAAEEYRAEEYARIATRICSEPGRSHRNLRRLLYRLLDLGQPASRPRVPPLPVRRLPGAPR